MLLSPGRYFQLPNKQTLLLHRRHIAFHAGLARRHCHFQDAFSVRAFRVQYAVTFNNNGETCRPQLRLVVGANRTAIGRLACFRRGCCRPGC